MSVVFTFGFSVFVIPEFASYLSWSQHIIPFLFIVKKIGGVTSRKMSGKQANLSVALSSQCPTRALFQLSRRDREYLSFNLVSETGSRISFFQSHASRRDRDFLSFNLVLRDEIENFFLSISCFETSMRIFPPNLRLRDESEKFCHLVSVFETRTGFFSGFHFCITFIFYKDEYTSLSRSWMKVKVVCLGS